MEKTHGILENFLSKKRANTVNKLIPISHRSGKILDIGCGAYPFFLLNTEFAMKHGIERITTQKVNQLHKQEIYIKNYDIEKERIIPYDDNYFDVLTMLAVFEHITTNKLSQVLSEIYRILKPGGKYILTTPAPFGGTVLKIMAKFKLINSDLFDEHQDVYTHEKVATLLNSVGFQKKNMCFGSFEIFMNLWIMATK
ncbi:MAG: class I SAM-dependent methyltransferase [Candidatus Scalindua sp.]|nr:class I SAM-dependent methyltransferase [Candidatus Scalindua sp.]MCR4344629.1 class I SAM-dependent methyltransferase [Candidatus Scalindua sp.]